LQDPALLRPGRVDRILYVGLPDAASRAAIFAVYLQRTPHTPDVTADALASATDGYSGAEIAAVCREAALSAMRARIDAPAVGGEHFAASLRAVRPRTSGALLRAFDVFRDSCRVECI
jgi:SpoVK/Ycf46/Vps4 family AAA+-type ATPase